LSNIRREEGAPMLKRRGFLSCAICAATGLVAAAVDAEAQAPATVKRTILQTTEYPGDKYVSILVEAEIEPGVLVARHTHPGVESAYLMEGGGTLSVRGQPNRMVKPGEGYHIPPEVPHSLQNGSAKTRVAITYIVEKDKPLASPALE
jgi:quercetin dioxygenase-like cupin family protein